MKRVFGMIVVLLSVCLIVVIFFSLYYYRIESLCNSIDNKNTEESIHKISNINNVNRYSSPLWARGILNAIDKELRLPLVTACKSGEYEVVKALLDKGCDPNKYLEGNWSPIEATFIKGNKERYAIAELLIEHGADVNFHGSNQSALFFELSNLIYSKKYDETEREIMKNSVLLLIDNGACLKDEHGNTIAHYLCYVGEVEFLDDLVDQYRISIEDKNYAGETPLMWASKNNAKECVEYLLNSGVDIGTKDSDGKTAYDYAVENNATEVISLLEN